MGVTITEETPDRYHVEPPAELSSGSIDCGLAGTVMRFVPPVAAFANGPVHFDGDEQARIRPMTSILDALRTLGVKVENNTLPFTVTSDGIPEGGVVEIDASASSQFVSGLLLSAPRFTNGVTVRHIGGRLPSMPHIEMTVAMLREVGIQVDVTPNQWTVHPGEIRGHTWRIEPDLSNATPFLAAAAVTRVLSPSGIGPVPPPNPVTRSGASSRRWDARWSSSPTKRPSICRSPAPRS